MAGKQSDHYFRKWHAKIVTTINFFLKKMKKMKKMKKNEKCLELLDLVRKLEKEKK